MVFLRNSVVEKRILKVKLKNEMDLWCEICIGDLRGELVKCMKVSYVFVFFLDKFKMMNIFEK